MRGADNHGRPPPQQTPLPWPAAGLMAFLPITPFTADGGCAVFRREPAPDAPNTAKTNMQLYQLTTPYSLSDCAATHYRCGYKPIIGMRLYYALAQLYSVAIGVGGEPGRIAGVVVAELARSSPYLRPLRGATGTGSLAHGLTFHSEEYGGIEYGGLPVETGRLLHRTQLKHEWGRRPEAR